MYTKPQHQFIMESSRIAQYLLVFLGLFALSAKCRPLEYTEMNNYDNISGISALPAPAHTANRKLPHAISRQYIPPASRSYNLLSYGAVGDGVTDDTQAFRMAWNAACQSNDSATVLAPRSYSFIIQTTTLTGPCKSRIVFQIEGAVMAPDGPDSWPAGASKRKWLVFDRMNGMTMEGGGMIDGRGQKWWNLPCKPHRGPNGTTLPGPCDSPVMFRFVFSSNLIVQRLRVQNSPQFHFRFDNCQNVNVNSMYITSPPESPNTDGIHVENINGVQIHNNYLSIGDDCVSIGAGSYNVDIRNITCDYSHGLSIGSLGSNNSRACVRNITATDAVLRNSDNGVRIKTWQGGLGSVRNVTFRNIQMNNVRNPIIIDQYYCSTKPCANQTTGVWVTGITYTGITGTYDVRSPAMSLKCSDAVPCTNLTMSDIKLYPAQTTTTKAPFCWKAYGVVTTATVPQVSCLKEGNPGLPSDDVVRC